MMKIIRKLSVFIAVAVISVVFGIVISFLKSDITLDYCRDIMYDGDNTIGISEGDYFTKIFKLDKQGNICANIIIPNTDYIVGRVINIQSVFKGDDNKYYVLLTTYDKQNNMENNICECDFSSEIIRPKWSTSKNISDGSIPSVVDGKLYFVTGTANTFDVYSINENNKETLVRNITNSEDFLAERLLYTKDGILMLSSTRGLYLNDNQIYEAGLNEQLSGIGYDGENFYTTDLSSGKIISVSVSDYSKDTVKLNSSADYEKLQNIRIYDKNTFSASYEDDGSLRGYIENSGNSQIISELSGSFRFISMLAASGLCFAVIMVLLAVYKIFSVLLNLCIKNSQAVSIRFVGITSKITLVTLIVALGVSIPTAKYMYEEFHSYNETNIWNEKISALRTISGYIDNKIFVESVGGKLQCMENTNSFFQDKTNDDELSDYIVYVKDDKGFYCIFSDEYVSGIDAEYTASLNAVDYFIKSTQSGEIYKFTDKRSIGKLSYISYPIVTGDDNGNVYKGVVVSQVDFYSLETAELTVFPQVILIALVTELLFAVMMNIILRFVLRRLRSVRKIISGTEQEKISVGNDEITETIRAMSAMKNGIELYMNDIRDCNLSYSKLLPMDLICLVSDKKLTDISLSDIGEKQMLYVRFDFEHSNIIHSISDFIRQNKGIILKLSARQICCGFRENISAEKIAKQISQSEILNFTKVLIAKGKICAKIMGDVDYKKAVYVCDAENGYDKISPLTEYGKIIMGAGVKTDFAQSDYYKLRLIAVDDDNEFYDLLFIDRENENKSLFKKKSFEKTLKAYYSGDKKLAQKRFFKLLKENPDDNITKIYVKKTSKDGAK